MEWRRFFLTTMIGGASVLTVATAANAVVLRGRVTVAKPAAMSACSTLDVVANVKTRDASGELHGDRDLVVRAAALRNDGSRWSYRLDVPALADFPNDTNEVTLGARCDAGTDPLVQPTVRATGGWQNPFAAQGDSEIKRNFRVRLKQASDPPAQIVLGPTSTDAFGNVGYDGSSPCDAEPPAFPGSDPHGTIAGSSNEPGSGCEMHTQVSGVLRFDLSGFVPYSERLQSAELRYTESALEWRNADGSPSLPESCVKFLSPDPAPPYGWAITRAVAEDRTTWDVTDLVWYWSESTDNPALTLLPEQVADDAEAAACLSQISNVELVITLGD